MAGKNGIEPANLGTPNLGAEVSLEDRYKALEAENAQLRAQQELAGDAALCGDVDRRNTTNSPLHSFLVTPRAGKHGLQPRTLKAPDESEAIRLYCITHRDANGQLTTIDSTRHIFSVKCQDEKRAERIRAQYTEKKTAADLIPALA